MAISQWCNVTVTHRDMHMSTCTSPAKHMHKRGQGCECASSSTCTPVGQQHLTFTSPPTCRSSRRFTTHHSSSHTLMAADNECITPVGTTGWPHSPYKGTILHNHKQVLKLFATAKAQETCSTCTASSHASTAHHLQHQHHMRQQRMSSADFINIASLLHKAVRRRWSASPPPWQGGVMSKALTGMRYKHSCIRHTSMPQHEQTVLFAMRNTMIQSTAVTTTAKAP